MKCITGGTKAPEKPHGDSLGSKRFNFKLARIAKIEPRDVVWAATCSLLTAAYYPLPVLAGLSG
jgi:hypothetical protein